MLLYHGSYHNFDFPNISQIKKYSKESSTLNEGYGLYCTTIPSIADSYGKYIYEIEVDTRNVKAFNTVGAVRDYIKRIAKFIFDRYHLNITLYMNVNNLCMYVVDGKIGVNRIGNEIKNILDNSEAFYMAYSNIAEYVFKSLELWDKRYVPGCYRVECSIPNTFIIKDFTLIKNIKKIKVLK